MINPERIFVHKKISEKHGPVIYWMSREQRVTDNWSLLFAIESARSADVQMAVVFCLVPSFLGATMRQYSFMMNGLKQVEHALDSLGIPFFLLQGDPITELGKFIDKYHVNHVVCDFDPLRLKRNWIKKLADKNHVNITEVDSHNIVPCRKASQKLEYGAYTIRPKIKRLLPSFLDRFPEMDLQVKKGIFNSERIDWDKAIHRLSIDPDVPPVDWIKPGEKNAMEMLKHFIDHKLNRYGSDRNDPNLDGLSNLSPYLHFGQLSPQRAALEIITNLPHSEAVKGFLEELIVRRELSDNFCFYNPEYDHFNGFHNWAKTSLNLHRQDEREFLYTLHDFESANTHDPLWNAAQVEMVRTGKMHGYMRMYWAKKILEWTRMPEEALEYAIHLNDRYQLDGRDPNGYAGCAWSIGGVHDRPWSERPVFGKIRYMNFRGCERKFDVMNYIRKWTNEK